MILRRPRECSEPVYSQGDYSYREGNHNDWDSPVTPVTVISPSNETDDSRIPDNSAREYDDTRDDGTDNETGTKLSMKHFLILSFFDSE